MPVYFTIEEINIMISESNESIFNLENTIINVNYYKSSINKLIKNQLEFSNNSIPYYEIQKTILKFTNIIEQSRFSLSEVKNLYFFPSKRWDIELRNNIILKLSKDHTRLSLDQAFEILNDNNFDNIKVVDARIKNQIILND